jgi:transposase-like protein
MKRRPSSSTPPANQPLTEAAFHRRVSELLDAFAEKATSDVAPAPVRGRTRAPTNRSLAEATREFQRDVVKQSLETHATPDGRWNISATARALGVARSHIYTLLDELGLEQEGLRRRRRGTADPIDPADAEADAAEAAEDAADDDEEPRRPRAQGSAEHLMPQQSLPLDEPSHS